MEKVYVNLLGKWTELSPKDTIGGISLNDWLCLPQDKQYIQDYINVIFDNCIYVLHKSLIVIQKAL